MTITEINLALNAHKKVYWINNGYQVLADNGGLYVIFKCNGFMARLLPSDLKDCFVGE